MSDGAVEDQSSGTSSDAAATAAVITRVESISDTGETSTSSSPARIIEPALVLDSKTGAVYELPSEIIAAIEAFKAPEGFEVEGTRETSFLYSLGIYIKPIGLRPGQKYRGQFFCKASSSCRRDKKMIPCANGDRSNVNKHLLKSHGLRGESGAKRKATRDESVITAVHKLKFEFLAALSRVCACMCLCSCVGSCGHGDRPQS